MKKAASLIVFGTLLTLAIAAQQGVILRREVKENTTEVYDVKTELKQTVALESMGEQELGLISSLKMTLKTGKVDATSGEADVESIVSDIKTEAEGAAAMLAGQGPEMPKEIKTAGKLDARNRMKLTAVKGMGLMEL